MKDSLLPHYSASAAVIARWYIPRYVRKGFHAVRLDTESVIPTGTTPTVIYLNHPSWWDPLISAVIACRFYPQHRHYSPIDADSLEQYPVMQKLGFFPVHKNTRQGASQFLQTSREVLRQPHSILWVTPQGDFVDAIIRPVTIKPGIGHLARDIRPILFAPMALEYTFWQDRLPEALIRIGPAINPESQAYQTAGQWTTILAKGLEHQQDLLHKKAVTRSDVGFTSLLSRRSSLGGIYDIRMRLGGKRHVSQAHRPPGADR